MFRVRFHGRGGQGIRTAGRVLGSAFFEAGFEVQDAPVYGAERRGAPMSACVRAAREPIRERGPIACPDLVVVADETLFAVPAAGVLEGMGEQTLLLVHSAASAKAWRERLALAGPVVTLQPAPGFAGTRCAGAAARLAGTISRAQLAAALGAEDRESALAAFDAMAAHAGIVRESGAVPAAGYARPEWIDLPLEAARLAAPDIFATATSVEVRTGLWRSLRPEIDAARCNRCSWICATLCPDSAIRVRAGGWPEIDYDHCKGCMICVAVCPPHAISARPERAAAA
jgi:pyruvate ferredoxin oxidoreductase gamma subunit